MLINDAIIGFKAHENLIFCNKVTICAKFSASCYFKCTNGDYIMLSAKKYGCLSFAISVDDPLSVLANLGDVGSSLTLDVSGPVWLPDHVASISEQNPEGMNIIEKKLTDFDDLFHEKINSIKGTLIECVQNEDVESTLSILNHFIGLGQGLTPSADDWTFAFLYTLKKTRRADFAKEVSNMLPEIALISTSFASYAYMSSLLDEDSVEIINSILNAYASRNDSIDSYCDILTSVGSSSGQDMLWGIYDALSLK